MSDPARDLLFGGRGRDLFLKADSGEGETADGEAGATEWTMAMSEIAGADLAGSNPVEAYDINSDGDVTALDALLIIGHINASSSSLLHERYESSDTCGLDAFSGTWAESSGCSQVWSSGGLLLDVNLDDRISPLDVLLIINQINASVGGEGEADGDWGVASLASDSHGRIEQVTSLESTGQWTHQMALTEWTKPDQCFTGRMVHNRDAIDFTVPLAKEDVMVTNGRSIDRVFDVVGREQLALDSLIDGLSGAEGELWR